MAVSRNPSWRPTSAHLRACFLAAGLPLAAVIARRPDLLVLAAPLAVVATWSLLHRPQQAPAVTHRLADPVVREGEATTWSASVSTLDGMEQVVVSIPREAWLQFRPWGGATVVPAAPGRTIAAVKVRSMRWGRRPIGPVSVGATTAWAAFRWRATYAEGTLLTLPLPATFDASAPAARANGLVGNARAARVGDGSEFASIRPFQVGDRLRRIHWPRSLRSGALHVTSTWADQDTHVVLVVDASNDIGVSEGIDGLASSLDVTVRAAGAIAEHYLHHGDRVSMRVFGAAGALSVAPSTGRAHLRRILDRLAMIRPDTERRDAVDRWQLRLPAGALAIMLSPLISRVALERAVSLVRHGLTVVVIDTLPDQLFTDNDPYTALAWRIRMLERRREMRTVQEIGVPVVAWQGPGSLDQFLRDVVRRAAAPRLVSR